MRKSIDEQLLELERNDRLKKEVENKTNVISELISASKRIPKDSLAHYKIMEAIYILKDE